MNRDKLLNGKIVHVITNRIKSIVDENGDIESEQFISIQGLYLGSDDHYIFLGDPDEEKAGPFHFLSHSNVTDILIVNDEDDLNDLISPMNGSLN